MSEVIEVKAEELAAIMEQSTARAERILRLEDELAKLREAQEPVATVTIQHFRQDPRMENVDFQLQVTLPQGTHKLYAAPQPVSDDAKDALVDALDALIADYDGEIHNEYDGTSMLDSRLSEINYAREALAAYRAAMEGSKGE